MQYFARFFSCFFKKSLRDRCDYGCADIRLYQACSPVSEFMCLIDYLLFVGVIVGVFLKKFVLYISGHKFVSREFHGER